MFDLADVHRTSVSEKVLFTVREQRVKAINQLSSVVRKAWILGVFRGESAETQA